MIFTITNKTEIWQVAVSWENHGVNYCTLQSIKFLQSYAIATKLRTVVISKTGTLMNVSKIFMDIIVCM